MPDTTPVSFDDLIPSQPAQAPVSFDDLIPRQQAQPSIWDQAAQYAPQTLSPDQESGLEQQFSQQHPYIYGAAGALTSMVPTSWDQAKQMLTLPRPVQQTTSGETAAQDEIWGQAVRGELGPVEQAKTIVGTGLQALPLLHPLFGAEEMPLATLDPSLAEAIRNRTNAIQEPQTGTVLQRQQSETGETGGQRAGVEPGQQGNEPAPESVQSPQEVSFDDLIPSQEQHVAVQDLVDRGLPEDQAVAQVVNDANFQPENEPRPTDQTLEQPPGQQQTSPEPAASVGTGEAPVSMPEGGISTQNAYTDAAREALQFPEVVQEASRDFGTVWKEAEATAGRDPGAGARLVDAINDGNVRSIDDVDNALLLREQIKAQGERADAADAVNNAVTDTDRMQAKARLEMANNRLEAIYDADRKAGRASGQGLNARKMLANEDYTLEAMRSRKRAANNGTLSDAQLQDVQALHDKIAELSYKVDKLQGEQPKGGFRSVASEGRQEAKAASGSKRFTDFMDEQAQKARERLIAKRGRLNAGIDPTNLVDEAIIGASHIAKGLTRFADWSAQMVKDFGDRIKPYLRDLWNKATAYHNEAQKAYRTPEQINLERYKARMAQETVGYKAKIERGDFTKTQRQPQVLDKAAYQMKANLQKLKNEFERGVAKDTYKNMSPADKFWQHFVGVERAMKLSSPAVFEKLGLAAGAREALAPVESAAGYGASKILPRLAKGTRYGADLGAVAKAEIKAKASMFTQGMRDAAQNLKGKETDLEAMSDKYGRQPDFWYNRIGKIHAAVKAPIKRAEFTRSLELRMNAATRAGEDINRPEVMDRLATESALDANRAIFQQNTVVSKFFSMLDKSSPAGGRVARFLFPVVKIPVNIFKELVTYHAGAPVAVGRIGAAYWKGIETVDPMAREAMIRQLVKGSVGGTALLWGYYNSQKVHDFFKSVPTFFEHTPIAMAIHEGSIIKQLEDQGTGTKYRPTEAFRGATNMAKFDIPFAYTLTGLTNALDPTNPHGWSDYLYGMIQSSTVPQAVSWTAKEMDKPTPFNPLEKPAWRPPQNLTQSIEQGIPGFRQDVPVYQPKSRSHRAR